MSNQDEFCEVQIIHEEAVAAARETMPADETLLDLADLFKMFADYTRVKILTALVGRELCVCDIAALLSMTCSAISHQLRLLRAAKLVRSRREGKIVYYSPDDDHIQAILACGLAHAAEDKK